MELSVCVIAKNEEKNIEAFLQALAPLEAELIFVDTGSTDRTKELVMDYALRQKKEEQSLCSVTGKAHGQASSTNIRVYDFAWCDDFSAARNFSIEKASSDTILSLDCDEIILWEEMLRENAGAGSARSSLANGTGEADVDQWSLKEKEEIGRLAKQLKHDMLRSVQKEPLALGRLRRIDFMGNGETDARATVEVRRLFSRKYFHYEGRIHEQLVRKDGQKNASYPVPILLEHKGYLGSREERIRKAERNNRLLFMDREVFPDDAYTDYQIAKSYIMMEENEKAIAFLESALRKHFDPTAEFVDDMLYAYGELLLNAGRQKQALELKSLLKTFGNNADFHTMMGRVFAMNGLWKEALVQFSAALEYGSARVEGNNTFLPLYYAGIIYDSVADKDMAGECLTASASYGYAPAKEELERL